MTLALEGGEGSAARPGRTLAPVPIVQGAGLDSPTILTCKRLISAGVTCDIVVTLIKI